MTTNEERYVTEEILTYYDSKIKNYIEDKVKEPKDELSEVERRVDAVETASAVNAANIASNREDIDELEIATRAMQETLADVRVTLENKVEATDLDKYLTKELAESIYYTKEQVADKIQEAIDLIPDVDTNNLVTKDELERALDDVATKDDLTVLNNAVADVEASLEDKADKQFVKEEIEKAALSGEVELSNYYTKAEVDARIPDVSNFTTKEELEAVQNVAGSNSVKLFAIESDLVDISSKLENIPTTYATKDEVSAVEAKVDSIVIPEVPTKVSELENDAGYITAKDIPETDLSNYYNKTETENLIAEAVKDIEHPTVDLEGYATEDWVNSQGFQKEHQELSEYAKKSDIPQPELFVIDYNAPNFAAAFEAYNNGKLLLLTNAAPDGNGYAVMNYVRDDMITFTKFLMSRSETYGAFNTYYLHSDNTWEVAKEVKLNKVDAIVDENQDITGLTIGKNSYDFDNFATTEVVNQLNENIENNYVSNTTLEEKNYVTEQHITQNYITIQDAANTYVTTEAVTEVVETQVNEVVTKEIETKVVEVIQEKVDNNEISVTADKITYGEF